MVAVELVFVVYYGADYEFHGDLGEEEGVRREDPRDGTECQAAEKTYARGRVARKRGGCGCYDYDQGALAEHPEDEGRALEEHEELIEIMWWFRDSAEGCDE